MTEGCVILLIRSLDIGGAERQVVMLAKELRRRGASVVVISFYGGGALGAELEHTGADWISLDKRGRWDVFGFVRRLVAATRRLRPSVVYGFLPTANALAALLRPFVPGALVVWGLRASALDLSRYGLATRLSLMLERALAWVPHLIIANSEAGRRAAQDSGFPPQKLVVVPNGIDTDRFRHDEVGGRSVRRQWGIGEQEPLVGIVARLDPMKDHATFLRAAQRVASEMVGARFVCVGEGPAPYRRKLQHMAADLGISDRIVWTGSRGDMPAVLSALDVACSASAFGEGFSNALAEAMACGVRCVGTDVGDTAAVLGDVGRLVPPADPAALAREILDLLRLELREREELRLQARRRMIENFSADALGERTVSLLSEGRRRAGGVGR